MTARVLRALDDPPSHDPRPSRQARLLLSREPYAIDLDAVLEKAARRRRRRGAQRRSAPPRPRLAAHSASTRARSDDRDRPRRALTERSGLHDDRRRDRAQGRAVRARRAQRAIGGRRAGVRARAARARRACDGRSSEEGGVEDCEGRTEDREARADVRARAAPRCARTRRSCSSGCSRSIRTRTARSTSATRSSCCARRSSARSAPTSASTWSRPRSSRAIPTRARSPAARQEDVEEIIRSTGFFRNKAKSLIGMATALVERHGGEVPADMDALVVLPGVGRKTANVILGNAFGRNDGIVVDTHVTRLSNRLALTTGARRGEDRARAAPALPAGALDDAFPPPDRARSSGVRRAGSAMRHLLPRGCLSVIADLSRRTDGASVRRRAATGCAGPRARSASSSESASSAWSGGRGPATCPAHPCRPAAAPRRRRACCGR